MEEPGTELENTQIPPHWNFPERKYMGLGLKVTDIDVDQGFLAFDLPDRPDYKGLPGYGGGYVDYFFDESGEPIDTRHSFGLNTSITVQSDFEVAVNVYDDLLERHPSLRIRFEKPATDSRDFFTHLLGSFSFESLRDKNKNLLKRKLVSVRLGEIFSIIDENGGISSPEIIFDRATGKDGLKTDEWELVPLNLGEFHFKYPKNANEAVFFDDEENVVFKLEWEITEEETDDPGVLVPASLVVTETHFPTQVRKVLQSPLTVDLSAVLEAAFAKPPYTKNKDGDLIVPWRGIGRIVGATLSYENLPQPKPENKGDQGSEIDEG